MKHFEITTAIEALGRIGDDEERRDMAQSFASTLLSAYAMPDTAWPTDEALGAVADTACRAADALLARLEKPASCAISQLGPKKMR